MSSKVQRQQLIAKIVSSQTVTSQPQLRELLKKKGIKATQATVSRDLEDLGAVKVDLVQILVSHMLFRRSQCVP